MVLAVASLNVLVSFLICQHEVLKKTFWDQIPRGQVRIIPKSIPAKVVLSKDREKSGFLVMFSEHTVGLKGWEHSVPIGSPFISGTAQQMLEAPGNWKKRGGKQQKKASPDVRGFLASRKQTLTSRSTTKKS